MRANDEEKEVVSERRSEKELRRGKEVAKGIGERKVRREQVWVSRG